MFVLLTFSRLLVSRKKCEVRAFPPLPMFVLLTFSRLLISRNEPPHTLPALSAAQSALPTPTPQPTSASWCSMLARPVRRGSRPADSSSAVPSSPRSRIHPSLHSTAPPTPDAEYGREARARPPPRLGVETASKTS
ncbi:hypothetical protein B0H14DRAFT_3487606 [Mycena olivaceomarginata]|nr:hypothetical protein B0H14DRAFT_3487606 [Mycena olivaceomarginata]